MRPMTERERQGFLAEPRIAVLSIARGGDRPPRAEQALAVAGRYLPEEQARGFVEAEVGHPSGEFVLFTVRPDRWLTFDFSDEQG